MNKTAILTTAIPPTLFAVTSIILTLVLSPELTKKAEGYTIVDICLLVSIGLLGIALLLIIGFAIKRKREIVKGMAVGFGIGFIVWAGSFITVSLLYDFWL